MAEYTAAAAAPRAGGRYARQTMVNYITMKPLVRMMMMLLGIRVMMTMIIMMKRHKLG